MKVSTTKANQNKGKDNNTMKTTTFADLMRNYETLASNRSPKTETAYTKALTDLATATAYSVLKKCIETSQNRALIQVKRDIAKDTALLDNTAYCNANAYRYRYNKDGDLICEIKDKTLHTALMEIIDETLGDGMDFVDDAIIAIMNETETATERNNGTLSAEFMETPYTIRRLKRKVWIKVEDSVKGWETVSTTPIQEVFKAVRRTIENSRAVQSDPRNGYSYIEDYTIDTETDEMTAIYRRLPKYADLGGNACDLYGNTDYNSNYTTDSQSVVDMDRLVASLNLSKQQVKILQLRLSGYSHKAIATYLGVRCDNIKVQLKRIQTKSTAIGLQPCTK